MAEALILQELAGFERPAARSRRHAVAGVTLVRGPLANKVKIRSRETKGVFGPL
jgi:hypothetical protein